ncbi:MAG: DUF488 domain-containing protein [Anaerolineae bacterium]|nr:DUF488 domain-containing protein [Anaerolineae bacterium]
MTKVTSIELKISQELLDRAFQLSGQLNTTPENVLIAWLERGALIEEIPNIPASQEHLTLYTIGHSNLSLEDFIASLHAHQIHTLIDVRSVPSSQYNPHFNRNNLEGSLKENGFEYRFAGEYLGGRPDDPNLYKGSHVPDKGTKREDFLELVQYEEVMKSEKYLAGLRGLLQIIRNAAKYDQQVAIMCSEGNPLDCHRHHLIARSLIDPKVKVVNTEVQVYHILRDRKLEKVEGNGFDESPSQPSLL